MPTTRKQKKARKSRGLEILSDIENLDIMLGENHFNDMRRDESIDGTSIRKQESVTSNNLENEDMNLHSDHRNPETGTSAGYDRITASVDSQAEINKLSFELNSRISREMDEMMNSVSSQIQRAISDAINHQVLPQIQNVIMAGSGQETRRGWERSDEIPESYSEVQYNAKTRTTLNNEHGDETHRNVHDRCIRSYNILDHWKDGFGKCEFHNTICRPIRLSVGTTTLWARGDTCWMGASIYWSCW